MPPAITQVEERAAAPFILPHSQMLPPKDVKVVSMQLHGLSDASQLAYAGVVYLRMIDEQGDIHTSETKVAPVMRSTIPRLDLYGARATCIP